MTLRNLLFPLLFAALSVASAAKPIDGFPPDTKGVNVQDRLYEHFDIKEKPVELYAVMYAHDASTARVEIYIGTLTLQGMEWKRSYTWNVPQGPGTIDALTAREFEGTIQLTSTSWFLYEEGRATPLLEYDSQNGSFTESMVD